MKIRILSDLHLDINRNYPIEYDKNTEEVFTVIAGDTSGYPEDTIKFLKENQYIKNGVFVSGNHIVYNDERLDIRSLQDILKKEFPKESNITYLENDYKVVNDIVFVGATLWTDYKYCGQQETNMWIASRYMNDFRWGRWKDSDGNIQRLEPSNCLQMHEESISYIDNITKQYPNNKIVVVTHHCPSPKCLSDKYINSSINASYISDLEQFILDRPNICAWCCGHIHNSIEFLIGNCKVISNPRGYQIRKENPNFDFNKIIEI